MTAGASLGLVSCRSSWRMVSSIESKKEEDDRGLAKDYREKIEAELNTICNEVLVSLLCVSV